jgi:hypothetical protein
MPNAFAYLVLFSWPVVVLWFLIRYPTKKAIFTSIVLSTLLLPSAFSIDLPLLPPIDKDTITGLSIVFFLFLLGKKFRIFQPGLSTKLFIGYFIVMAITVQLNTMPIFIGNKFLPGLKQYDVFSFIIRLILYTMPFYLGRYFSNSLKDTEIFFKIMVTMALVYTLPMLFELKMSPQLHNIAYGYQPSQFVQQMRQDGYRPMVFVGHGLGLAFWMSTCVLAAAALLKNKIRTTIVSPLTIVSYLFVILMLCKTWSATAYAILGMVFIFKLRPSTQVKWSFILASLIILYPITKANSIFPEKEIISTISQYSPERAQSLEFRFQNENEILAHVLEKPFFGWGGWGRNRIYSEWDGRDLSVVDGRWIAELGTNGWIGFIFCYAILLTPLYYALKTFKYIKEPKEQVFFAALAVILTICIIDSIPNTGMGPTHLFLAGILLGQAELLNKQKYLIQNEETKPSQ